MNWNKLVFSIFLVLLLSFTGLADNNSKNNDISSNTSFDVDPGILPDSPFYFLDTFMEERSLGHDPEKALQFKEEKMAEAKAMAAKRNKELTKEVLDRAYDYGKVLEKEVTPQMEDKVKDSAVREKRTLDTVLKDVPDVKEDVLKNIDQTEKIVIAAKVSSKIKELCATLAKLDSVAYAQTCKISESSPQWLKEEHQQLSTEQEEQTKVFASKLSDCFDNPSQCDCKGMGVKSFEDICMKASRAAAECQKGDNKACDAGSSIQFDPKEYLPDYLIPIFEEKIKMQDKRKKDNDLVPDLCKKGGATSEESCQKIMMEKYLPSACKEAGISTKEECMNLIKSQHGDFPAPCRDAGTEEECTKIMQQWGKNEQEKGFSDHMNEDMPSDIKEKVKQCLGISNLDEKEKCFQSISTTFKDDQPNKGESDIQKWSEPEHTPPMIPPTSEEKPVINQPESSEIGEDKSQTKDDDKVTSSKQESDTLEDSKKEETISTTEKKE